MTASIPTTGEDLTADWLTSALRDGGLPDVTVSSVAIERIGEGVGFIGQLHRLTIGYDERTDDAPETVIAKMPTNDPGGRMMGGIMRLYETESGFYRHLAAESPIRSARCFYNGADVEAGNYCLLLEDLGHLEPGDQLTPLTMDQTVDLLTMMAKAHATWSDGRGDGHRWLRRIDDASSLVLLGMFDEAYPVTMELHGHVIPEYMHDWGPRFAKVAPQWVADFARQPGTIVHGDFRTDNFMFGPDGPEVLLDWQVAAHAPGAYDVYYFLATCPDAQACSANLDDLLDHYLGVLASEGATAPTKDVLLDQMRGVGLFLTTLGIVTFSQIDPANERGSELFLSMWRRGIELAETIDLTPELPPA